MEDNEIYIEEIRMRDNFILDITIKNLLDYNGFLNDYQDSPYYFEVSIGIIIFEEFYEAGPIFRKELQPMIIT